MKGSYRIVVQNSLVQFKLQVNRNITIIRGDSATGKSTLVEMIRQFGLNGAASGVTISCRKECTVLAGLRWQNEIREIKDSIVFLDEGFPFVSGNEFAEAIQHSDNYYVIATRETLFNLPYSIKEIYGLKNVTRKSKYQEYDRIYSEFYPLYNEKVVYQKPKAMIVEDTNAGFFFFQALCEKEGIRCISAGGKSNVYRTIKECREESMLVIADGAAFGPELERTLAMRKTKNAMFFLPESFEWLILRSGLIDGKELQDILNHPYDFIESERYFSWERFFTALLTEQTKDTYLSYNKSKLNPGYLKPAEMEAVKNVINEGMEIRI